VKTLKYSVKICHSSESVIEEWEFEQFKTLKHMRDTLLLHFKDRVTNDEFLLGYFTPGHSTKGKQIPLKSDEDLNRMYSEHHSRRCIYLWVKSQVNITRQTKRPRNPDEDDNSDKARPAKKPGVYSSHLQKVDELEEILDKLKSKQKGSKYTPEQLHAWAHTIQMGKHNSYDAPPNKPFFGKQSQPNTVSSPGKRIQLRTQCIDQLTKWHRLMEDQVISKEEYQEMHKTIMSDIKKF